MKKILIIFIGLVLVGCSSPVDELAEKRGMPIVTEFEGLGKQDCWGRSSVGRRGGGWLIDGVCHAPPRGLTITTTSEDDGITVYYPKGYKKQ